MPNDQPKAPGEAKPFAASGGLLSSETPPQAPADTAGAGDTESAPDPLAGNECVNEAACNRLEKSWFDGAPLSIESCLENVSEQELQDTLEELVCIEMEFLWKKSARASAAHNPSGAESTPPTSLEDYLRRFPQLNTPPRMERLVSEEIARRLQVNEAIDPADYRQRFPDLIGESSRLRHRLEAIPRQATSRESKPQAVGHPYSSDRTVSGSRTADLAAEPCLRSFGDYELLQEIARGGMGVVYKARQTKLNRVVALKMILSGQLASTEDVQRFYVEAEAAASLEHPGIVPIHEIGEHDDQHFFSMGFIEGASLESQVKDGPLPPREAATVVQRVSEAIAYAHTHGVIHRDLKPANILIDTGGEPKVTDFGLAKKTEGDSGLTGTGQILGTPGYMPPEQASGETDTIGSAADIYSLGAILYALLTGRPPFQSATPMDTLVAVLEQEPVAPRQLNPALDPDLETICLKCLQKDIKRRYATADQLVAELGRYLNGEPIHARPIGKLERGWRWCQRKPALAGLSVMAVILLLMLGIGGPLVALQQSEYARRESVNAYQQFTLRAKAERALAAQLKAERERRVTQARSLRQATPQAAATILKELDRGSSQIQDALRSQLSDSSLSPLENNRIRMGLLSVDPEQLEPIVRFVLFQEDQRLKPEDQRLKPEELLLIREVLTPHGADLVARFLPSLEHAADRLRVGCLLAGFAANGDFWPAHADGLAADLVRVLPSELRPYRNALRPIQEHLIAPLATIYRDDSASEQARAFATNTLADYLSNDAPSMFDLLADATEQQFGPMFNALTAHQQQAITLGNAEVARTPADTAGEDEKEALGVRQANTAVMLLRMHAAEHVWPLLKHSPDPRVRSYIIHWLNPRGGDVQAILARFGQETDVTIKRALLLCLGEFNVSRVSDSERQTLVTQLLEIYRSDSDAGLRGAAEWLLRQWKQGDQLTAIDAELQQSEADLQSAADKTRQWYINGQGQTFVVLEAGEFQMGNLALRPGFVTDEKQHLRRINRRFAIASKEVTKAQWRAFSKDKPVWSADVELLASFSRTDDSPMMGMTWFEAAWYCNWLSAQEGVSEDQWCYLPNRDGRYASGMKAKDGFLKLTGYRLPIESEWEYACRAHSVTHRYYGLSDALLSKYARYARNSARHAWPAAGLKPNDFGLFDMHGNAYERCYDLKHLYPIDSTGAVKDAPGTEEVSAIDRRVVRGGAFTQQAPSVRSEEREYFRADLRNYNFSFRAARTFP